MEHNGSNKISIISFFFPFFLSNFNILCMTLFCTKVPALQTQLNAAFKHNSSTFILISIHIPFWLVCLSLLHLVSTPLTLVQNQQYQQYNNKLARLCVGVFPFCEMFLENNQLPVSVCSDVLIPDHAVLIPDHAVQMPFL